MFSSRFHDAQGAEDAAEVFGDAQLRKAEVVEVVEVAFGSFVWFVWFVWFGVGTSAMSCRIKRALSLLTPRLLPWNAGKELDFV